MNVLKIHLRSKKNPRISVCGFQSVATLDVSGFMFFYNLPFREGQLNIPTCDTCRVLALEKLENRITQLNEELRTLKNYQEQ